MNTPGAGQKSGELTDLQRWFQTVVTHAEGVEAGVCSQEAQELFRLRPGELERVVTRSHALSAAERLGIYANAYYSRLLECLGEVFPMLKRTLGEDAFDGLAFGYLQAYPSRSYTLNELGRHFPHYLEQTRPGPAKGEQTDPCASSDSVAGMEDWPLFLIDLARLEWAIYEVFDGPGVEGTEPLSADQLLSFSSEHWPKAKLTPVVCLQLLATRFPVNDYYTALRRSKPEDPVRIPLADDCYVALTRRDFVVRRYNVSKPQFELLTLLQQGRTVGQAIEAIVPTASGEIDELATNLQLWFRNWTAEGFFESVSVGA